MESIPGIERVRTEGQLRYSIKVLSSGPGDSLVNYVNFVSPAARISKVFSFTQAGNGREYC
jgi:hypothetical protein